MSGDVVELLRDTDPRPARQRQKLEAVHAAFDQWLHMPDKAALHFALGVVAANRLPGDPVWGLLIGGPGRGKTETLNALSSLPDVHPVSTVTEAGLLSATPNRERSKTSTGGLLRQIGDYGIVVVKDFTSVLSLHRDARAQVLAALREVYDGRWDRLVGQDGGRTLTWEGKAGLLGGCTPIIDKHHAVMAAMGERFVQLRLPPSDAATQARRALAHRATSKQMRGELADAVSDLFAVTIPDTPELDEEAENRLVTLAEFVARCRSVSIARGPSPFGPWEPCPHNPVLTHRGLALEVQNVGHGDLVERPDGTWAMVYLGVRTGGQGRLWSFARETFAQEVEWVDGWPVMGEPIVPATDALTEVDDFAEIALGQQWVSPGRWPAELVDLTDRAGWLTLAAADGEPSLVARRQQHLHCTARAWVDASAGTGGLSLRVDPHHHYDVEVGGGRVRAVAAIGPLRSTLADAPLDAHRATLRIDVVRQQRPPWERHGLDEVVLGYEAADGRFTELARLDGRYLAIEVAGALRGRTFALYAADGIVRFDRFTYEGNDAGHPSSTTQ